MTQALAANDSQVMTTAQYQHFVTEAEGKARVLTDIVERQQLYTIIGTKKHLHVEAWEVLGAGYGLSARTAPNSTEPLYAPDGTLLGVRSRVEIVDNGGIVRGGAESFCTYDESETRRDGATYERWRGHPLAQLAGMAQTRATARAYRQMIAWVVQLAGYSPTPFEELDVDRTIVEGHVAAQGGADMCPRHNIAFFQSGKMREPAHKMPDGSWCNKSKAIISTPQGSPAPQTQAADVATGDSTAFFTEGRKLGFDSMQALNAINVKSWTEWTAKGNTLAQAIQRLQDAKAKAKAWEGGTDGTTE